MNRLYRSFFRLSILICGVFLNIQDPNIASTFQSYQSNAYCDLQIGIPPVSTDKTVLMDLDVADGPAQQQANLVLLNLSHSYIENYYDEPSGALLDQGNHLDVRDTAISAFVWAESGLIDKALRAIDFVLEHQVIDSSSPHYGNFLVHSNDSEPTDANWSAFVGSYLLVFVQRYEQQIGTEMTERLKNSIYASMHHRLCTRMVTHDTNIAMLSSFALIKSGEILSDEQFLNAGKTVWDSLVNYTLTAGFAEYNSVNYYKVDLYALGFLADYIEDERVAYHANELRQLLWCSISSRYHLGTRQVAGPFSRSLTDRMAYEFEGMHPFLYRDSGGRLTFPIDALPALDNQLHAILPVLVSPSWPSACLEHALSEDYRPYQTRERVRILIPEPEIVQQITTYLDPNIALGSVNTAPLIGSQLRPLIAHIVDPNQEVGVFKLGDIVSTSPGNVWIKSVQNYNSALISIWFDMSHQVQEETLELRLVWLGTYQNPPYVVSGNIDFGNQFESILMNVPISIRLADNLLPTGIEREVILENSDEQTLRVRFVSSFPKDIETTENQLTSAVVLAFGVHFGELDNMQLNPVEANLESNGQVSRLTWTSPNGLLELALPLDVNNRWYMDSWINHVRVIPVPLTYYPQYDYRLSGFEN